MEGEDLLQKEISPEAQKTYLCGFLTCNVETIPIKEKNIIFNQIKTKQNKTNQKH